MKGGYIIRDQEKSHFLTCTIVDWIDILHGKVTGLLLQIAWISASKIRLWFLFGYVVMSNHIHIIVQSKEGKLSDLIRDFKKFTAKRILEALHQEPESRKEWIQERSAKATESHSRNTNYQIWGYGGRAEEIFMLKFMWDKLNYII